jgi:hypothetical protein
MVCSFSGGPLWSVTPRCPPRMWGAFEVPLRILRVRCRRGVLRADSEVVDRDRRPCEGFPRLPSSDAVPTRAVRRPPARQEASAAGHPGDHGAGWTGNGRGLGRPRGWAGVEHRRCAATARTDSPWVRHTRDVGPLCPRVAPGASAASQGTPRAPARRGRHAHDGPAADGDARTCVVTVVTVTDSRGARLGSAQQLVAGLVTAERVQKFL